MVTTVQSSSRTRVSARPALTMGSIAMTYPGLSWLPVPGCRSSAPGGARACPGRCRGRRTDGPPSSRWPPRTSAPPRRCRRCGCRASTIAFPGTSVAGSARLPSARQRELCGAPCSRSAQDQRRILQRSHSKLSPIACRQHGNDRYPTSLAAHHKTNPPSKIR